MECLEHSPKKAFEESWQVHNHVEVWHALKNLYRHTECQGVSILHFTGYSSRLDPEEPIIKQSILTHLNPGNDELAVVWVLCVDPLLQQR
jgi:hypothetical protein